MSRSNKKERSKRKYAPIKTWMEKQTSGFKASYLKLPKGASLFEVKVGTALIDVVPYEVKKGKDVKGGNPHSEADLLYWERTFWTHRNVGPNQEAVICPARTFKKPCPICQQRAKIMKNDPDDDEEKMAKEMLPKERQIINVIDRKNPDKGVQILEMSSYLFGEVLQKELRNADEEDNWDLFFTADDGKTLKVGFGEDKMGTQKFVRADSIHFKDRKEQYDEDEIVGQTHDLDKMLIELNYEALKDLYLEGSSSGKKKKTAKEDDEDEDDDDTDSEDEDDDDEEEEEKPKKGKSSKSGKKKSSKSDSDDDDDEEEEDDEDSDDDEDDEDSDDDDDSDDEDEDEEDEPKKKKGKKPAKKSKDDDEDEDDEEEEEDDDSDDDEDSEEDEDEEADEDDDDEEDEKPKKKKGAKSKSKSKSKDDDDDEDEEEEDSDEDDDSDDDDFDEEEDDEEEEDDDEDEKPKKKKKK